jgi:hypothetical protein
MRGLFIQRGIEAERGAVATIVAVFFGGLVVAGMLALTVDVGNIMWERRQLQNGADAGVLSLAVTCANDPAKCNPNNTPTGLGGASIEPLISKNAADGVSGLQTSTASTVNGQCGRATGNIAMPTCASAGATVAQADASLKNLGHCPPVPGWLSANAAIPYVETYTISKQTSGSTVLPGYFSKMLTGTQGGTVVSACSRAAWGPVAPTSLNVFPIVMSYCDWAEQTGYKSGVPSTYPPGPDYSVDPVDGYVNWPATPEQKIYTKGNPTACSTWNGHSAPGGFYAINDGNSCTSNVAVNGWIEGDPGNDNPCKGMSVDGKSLLGKVVHIPVYDCSYGKNPPSTITSSTDCESGKGSNNNYHIAGYAAFYVTGWHLSGDSQKSIRSNSFPCGGGDRCISGWFIKDLLSEGDIVAPNPSGPPNFGLNVVKAAG